jgi:alkanesulfonate monooxygenase SsuD/methylene tetrahydromethanopterin reductase-like flavin-dependent oxidoreductase (luciferase family)
VPIWVSGTIRGTTVSRLARFGAKWIPWGPDAVDLKQSIPRIKDALAKAGGDADSLQVVGHLPVVKSADGSMDVAQTMDRLPALVEAGVTDFVTAIPRPSNYHAAEEKLYRMVTAFRVAVGRPGPDG